MTSRRTFHQGSSYGIGPYCPAKGADGMTEYEKRVGKAQKGS